jgi:hypothetical protein
MRKLALLLTLLAATYVSCRKDDSDVVLTLPAATQTGAQTFGFLVNGVVWINYGQLCQPNGGSCRDNLEGMYFPSDGGITLRADQVIYKDGVSQTQYVELELLTGFGGEKTYSTVVGDHITALLLPVNDLAGYATADVNPNFTVTITRLDTNAGIISGVFSGSLFRRLTTGTSPIDSVSITEGRFDVRYK